MAPTVHILLSTYNGARYLPQQLDSLLAQDYPQILIHIRDDGSTDDTADILARYAARHANMHLSMGDNMGVVGSFLALLRTQGEPSDFYALCDQDDIWRPNKISRAVTRIEACSDPAMTLYFGRLQYVDDDLHPIRLSAIPRHPGFANAVVENAVTGCTAVFGDGIRRLAVQATPESMYMHDWWLYLVAAAFGELVFDPEPCILYRQHAANVSQWEQSRLRKVSNRLTTFVGRFRRGTVGFASLNQATAFLATYGNALASEKRHIVAELLALRGKGTLFRRVRYALRPNVHRDTGFEDLMMRLLIVLGQH